MNLMVFLLSASILAYEVVLMRMFSIAQWHHFASMIISIALLGFGLSGTLLSVWRARLSGSFALWAMGFVLTVPLCTWLAQRIPFTPFLIIWEPRQLFYLLCIYLLLTVPFTFGALAIGMALIRARESQTVGRTYAANLLGSGVGAIAGLMLCYLPLPVKMSEYKGLQKALAMAGSHVVQTTHHPLGRVDIVENPALRVAPGLSITYPGRLPSQRVMFVDGDGGSAIFRATADDAPLEYLQWLPSAVPYDVVRPTYKVLVIGVGGGTELHQAFRFDVHELVGVEMHPRVAVMAAETVPGSDVRVAEGRAFIRRSRERYDIIQISLLDSLAATAVGVGAANESYLYTVEALSEFIDHLADTGVLCITRWLKTPPRDNVKMFATAVEALERRGVSSPAEHLMFIRGWATGTLLVKRTAFTAGEVARARQWADQRAFDVDYFPGATEQDVNLRNVMDEPAYFRAAQAILSGDREEFYRNYLFNVRPAKDSQPYFFHFFRWKTAPHLLRTMGREWVPFVEWGYVVLVATLVQAVVASVLLIGLPLLVARRRFGESANRGPTFAYFACLGLGFMLLEMSLLQKFTLFLGNPLYAAAVVIATFLVFAGAGASLTGPSVRDARLPATAVVALALVYVLCLPVVFRWGLGAADAVRFAIAILLLAPLAFFMGMLFPLGLSKISEPVVPWAWGVNGCFSVIGAVLAAVISMDFGFLAVMLSSAILYACAGVTYRRLG